MHDFLGKLEERFYHREFSIMLAIATASSAILLVAMLLVTFPFFLALREVVAAPPNSPIRAQLAGVGVTALGAGLLWYRALCRRFFEQQRHPGYRLALSGMAEAAATAGVVAGGGLILTLLLVMRLTGN